MWLTPAERRGAVILVAILLTGTGWDLWRVRLAHHRSSPAVFAARDSVPAALPAPPFQPRTDSTGALLDLNRATAAALDGLPGIGPVLASRIVARRTRVGPYRRPEDLLDVPGIGPRLYERLRPLVAAGSPGDRSDSMHSAKPSPGSRADSPSDQTQRFR